MIVPFEIETARIGDVVRVSRVITEEHVAEFARLSGDDNPLHMDADFARGAGFRGRVAHGMIAGGLLSQAIGTKLPGPGALWTEQSFRWPEPVYIGDTITLELAVTARSTGTNTVAISAKATNQDGKTVMEGAGVVRLAQRRAPAPVIPARDRCAFVSGSDSDTTRAVALALQSTGMRIAVFGDAAEQICNAVRDAGGQAIALHGDLQAAVEEARRVFERPVDVLVLQTPIGADAAPFLDLSWSALNEQVQAYLVPAILASQAVIPGMIECGSGRIIFIGPAVSSMQSVTRGMLAAGLKVLTGTLAAEFGPRGIRANLIAAGMLEGDPGASLRMQKLQALQTPLRRLATPEDIGRAVQFLCSEQADFISGAVLPVSGGVPLGI